MNPAGKELLRVYTRLRKVYGPQRWWPAKTRFEVIIGAILTQNTAWSNVEKAIKKLKDSGLLSHEAIRNARPGTLERAIKSAGYFNVKAGRIKNFVRFLYDAYGGSLSRMAGGNTADLRTALLSVNGIGPETCDSILLYAFKRPVFVVDAYTKRIFARYGLFREGVSYGEVQSFFMDNLPKSERLYNEYHALIVRHAKEHCRTRPRCRACHLRADNCLEKRIMK